jgi:mono/diheme cytochrome c family protein
LKTVCHEVAMTPLKGSNWLAIHLLRKGLQLTMGQALMFLILALQMPAVRAGASVADGGDLEQGRRIFQEGMLPSGSPLTGMRFGNATVSGKLAACANCHRRSGMGSVEGDIQMSPINGRFLFAQSGDKALATMDPRVGKRMNQVHEPYNDESLANAIRRGVNNGGREMNVMMPRYALGDSEMKALIAYLRQLSGQWSPGVSAETIHFATVITPGVEPERRKVLLDMMSTAFAQKNGSTANPRLAGGRRRMVSAAEMVLGTQRKWQLEVWDLQGPPETWAAQLQEYYRRQPVFAVISGLSNTTWEPVHAFCEHEQVPCWFPSVDLPPVTAQAFYPVYFSRGVMLEADVLAKHLLASGAQRPQRLVQIYRDDYMGRGAAMALRRALAGSGIALDDRPLTDAEPESFHRAVSGINDKDNLMFWLRPADLAALDKVAPTPAGASYFSGRLGGGENGPYPAAWKGSARLVYPYEMPERREANLAYFHQWLKLRNLPLVDEPLQSEIYFALNFLTDTVAEMLDNLYRDYLLERAENMVSRREGGKAEEEVRARDAVILRDRGMGRVAMDDADERSAPAGAEPLRVRSFQGKNAGTTLYPRLSLGSSQRFASKGGYIAHFAGDDSDRLVAESGWIVP